MVRPILRSRVHKRRSRSAAVVATLAAAALATLSFPGAAEAATNTSPTIAAGHADLGTLTAGFDDGTFHASASLNTSVDWSQPSLLSVSFDPNLVRQGRSLDPVDSWAAAGPAVMTATYSVSATAGFTFDSTNYDVNFGPITFSASGPCTLLASGGTYTCHLESDELTVFQGCPDVLGESTCPLSPKVTVKLVADATITPDGVHTLRTATIGGNPAGTNSLVLNEAGVTDPLAVPCSAAVGDPLSYQLGDYTVSPGISLDTGAQFDVEISSPIPPPFDPFFPYITVDTSTVPITTGSGTAAMSGAGATFALGNVAHNNIAPTLTVAPSFSGDEGSPIAFSASASGPCAAGSTYRWDFSDGTTAFGSHPNKTFTDAGPYTGTVTVTDSTGLTAAADFDVTVDNLPPVVKVLPASATVAWGRDLTIQTQALDPGTGDQPYLTYAWDFGDATPVVIGGASETHQWTTPGLYTVTVTVCDNDGACTPSQSSITVRKRNTTVAYTGDNVGTYSATTTLMGSLVDEFGSPVNGDSLTFDLNGPAGSATTGANGVASRTATVGLPAGSYSVSSAFAGDALYTASNSVVESYTVSTMATVLTYTGTLSGKPNGTVPLSARLTDALGRPLAGKAVIFHVGTQVTGTIMTDANGVAATTLKLTQKPGTYPLSVSFAGEAGHYNAASATASFKLNSK